MMPNVSRIALLGVSLAALTFAAPPLRAEEVPTGSTPSASSPLELPPLPEVPQAMLGEKAEPAPAATAAPAEDHGAPAPSPASAPVVDEPAPVPQKAEDQAPAAPATAAAPASPADSPAPAAAAGEPAPVAEPVQKAQETPVAPEPPPLSAAAQAVKQAVEALAKEPARTISFRKERDGVTAFYAARNYEPVWSANGAWTPAARATLARLERAGDDTIDIKAGSLPVLNGTTDNARASADVSLSMAAVSYGRQASGSRVDPQSIAKLITEKPQVADAATILNTVSAASDADAALRGFNPQQPGYAALRDKLAELRRAKPSPSNRVAEGPTLKVGMKDPRVPVIRARFGLDAQPLAESAADLLYDTRVASAVADFQRTHGIPASGQLTARTVAALSGGDPARLESEIIANMERWRWMPHQYSPERIEVNIPEYTVRLMRDNQEVHRARVVVGKPDTPTPVFSNKMQFIEVNPYWNVPPSIIKNEMLPKLAQDPTYLQRMGYEVRTVRGRLVVRQPPGERNALGRIKFMFPNEHAVYLHDTPSRSLFANEKRAYSHGCVRLDQPFKFAEMVLGGGWTEDRVKKLIGGKNQTIHLPHNIEIHIEYFTAFVDQNGKLQLREDIYGYTHKLKTALGLAA